MNRREFITALGVVGAGGRLAAPGTAGPAGRRGGPRRVAGARKPSRFSNLSCRSSIRIITCGFVPDRATSRTISWPT